MENGLAAPTLGVAGTRSLGITGKISTTTPVKILMTIRITQPVVNGELVKKMHEPTWWLGKPRLATILCPIFWSRCT